MPKVSLVGVDNAGGGIILGGVNPPFTVSGSVIAMVGDRVAPHGDGPHRNATLVQGSTIMTVKGIPIVLAGMRASCGCTTTGSAPWDVAN